jgi:hypothetical protein
MKIECTLPTGESFCGEALLLSDTSGYRTAFVVAALEKKKEEV